MYVRERDRERERENAGEQKRVSEISVNVLFYVCSLQGDITPQKNNSISTLY